MKGGGGEGGTIADVKKYIVEGNGEDGESVWEGWKVPDWYKSNIMQISRNKYIRRP
jgi:hypothetical protein